MPSRDPGVYLEDIESTMPPQREFPEAGSQPSAHNAPVSGSRALTEEWQTIDLARMKS